jgi:hypothetical protein
MMRALRESIAFSPIRGTPGIHGDVLGGLGKSGEKNHKQAALVDITCPTITGNVERVGADTFSTLLECEATRDPLL